MSLFSSLFASDSAPTACEERPCMVEELEGRSLFSAAPAAAHVPAPSAHAPALTVAQKLASAAFQNKIAANGVTTLIPLTINEIVNRAGQLVALGTLGGTPFELPITLTGTPGQAGECDVLHLALGPIHLDLLGLNVDTSAICLDITGEDGPGNLLGNLVCDVAGLLDGGSPLGGILGGLSGANLNTLLTGLTDILNGALGAVTAPTSLAGVSGTTAGATDILNLSLGPVHLDLLGLNVDLDDCNGGPVTVDITAVPGPGNLLGNLLGGVAHLLDNPSNPTALANAVNRLANAILGLL